jgi:asparagine synthase (glutamine-hydrolysing)
MSYCGPDRQEVWVEGEVGLGHALLGFTPEPPADESQPCSLDGSSWIIADARIDARSELVKELRVRGRRVSAETPDAHLILHGYATWGERCVEHLIGDFAFAIWDGARRRLFCARDHFGVVPFYYARTRNGILFGNVLWALRAHPDVCGDLDERAIGDHMLFGVNMDLETTMFADIHALAPSHTLTRDRDGLQLVRRYWQPAKRSDAPCPREEDYVERFRSLLDAAVSDRLRTSCAGTHLSGGMDSTSVAASAKHVLAARREDYDLRAYTIEYEWMFPEREGPYADLTAAHIDLPIERVIADRFDPAASDPMSAWVFPEPGVVVGKSPAYEVGRRVASFSRALLTGIGGDPLFVVPRGVAASPGPGFWRSIGRGRIPHPGVRTAARRGLAHLRSRGTVLPPWIDAGFAHRQELPARWEEVRAELEQRNDERDAMLHPTWPTIFSWSHPGASGLPKRSLFPFFDTRLVDYVWDAPFDPWRRNKYLLRAAMSERLPAAVLERPKAPLYSAGAYKRSKDPVRRLALDPRFQRYNERLLTAPPLAQFVNVESARALIRSPAKRQTLPSLNNCFVLAQWLQDLAHAPINNSIAKETDHALTPAV